MPTSSPRIPVQRRARSVSKITRPIFWDVQASSRPAAAPPQDPYFTHAIFSPLAFATHFLHFQPEPAQAHVLSQAHYAKSVALNCNRQWGKSTLAAILITHRLVTQPNSLVLIVAPARRQSGEVALKVKDFLLHLNIETHTDKINPGSIVLPNGSRLVTLPAVDGTARGFSAVSMLLFDEASRIKDRIYFAFRPMLAVGNGDLIIVSTPNGRRGFFYREMTSEDRTWFRHTGPVSECTPRITEHFIAAEKSKGEAYFNQEWLCLFVETGLYVLDETTVQKLIKNELEAYSWL